MVHDVLGRGEEIEKVFQEQAASLLKFVGFSVENRIRVA
jgi:hypothetical protein